MTRPAAGARIADRLAPVAWAVLAAGAAVAAALAAGGLAGMSAPVLVASTLARVGMDVAGVACVGLALVGVLLPSENVERAHVRALAGMHTAADRGLVVAAAAWLLLVVFGTAVRTADAFGRTVLELGVDQMVRWATLLSAGRGMVLTAGCAAVVLVCAVVRLWDPERVQIRIPLVAALLGVLTPAVTGHSGSAPDHQLAVITVALHVAAASVWVGGLAALVVFVARTRELLAAALPRFSRLAALCLVFVGLTGVLNAQVRLTTWDALLTTGYGWIVVAKGVLLGLVAWLGWLARSRLRDGRLPVLRWALFETGLMAAALGLAAALTQTGT
ncbi:copper resistance D family protein [Pseudonocardia sp. TRM90224]|uniref:copper resistance D family protein n=1 Tax=Pseudonocardia sp. TRM90224 TaxID=2812678 RepID=UPI001E4CDBBD|nr:CopD family protein [Pseudonocardia sp. TRM90224]